MKPEIASKISLESLVYLPSFAGYLLQNRLDEYVHVQISISEELDLPVMKFLKDLSHEQLFELSKKTSAEFLTYLSENCARKQIEHSISQWLSNRLPMIQQHQISAEDITMITYLRKRTMLHFIPDYCSDTIEIIELIKEIDFFLTTSETVATDTYINLLKENISDNTHLIEKVNQTVPGALYVFDIENFRTVYSNHKLGDIIGYDVNELNELGEGTIQSLLHPDDRRLLQKHIAELKNARDGEIHNIKYRVKDKEGNYHWLSNYESVFKRNEAGKVIQTIGITLNIDKEQLVAEELEQSQDRYKQAEALTHIGNYEWNLVTNQLKWSDEMFRIYEMKPQGAFDPAIIRKFNHPEDDPIVSKNIEEAVATKSRFDFYYRVTLDSGAQKILHARGEAIGDYNGQAAAILGTAQDVTEKQNLIRELKQKESLYKQAEELANMGNWSWDVKNNKLEWTDQLYRIYGLEPQSEEITIERFLSFVHPDDRKYVSSGVDELFHEDRLDYTFRIQTADGRLKILRSVAQVQKDDKGNPVLVVGTERDITEKQTLIDKLTHSQYLYKQAQSLAHLGNWSWDIKTNHIEWSDELYQIYGLEPGMSLSYEKYLEKIHPDDLEKVKKQVQHSLQTKEPWEYTHKLIRQNGDVRIVFATGEVVSDDKGESYMMIGTAQDITERQLLIEKLQESERLSAQAQTLAHLGNWTMDIKTKEFRWSDEMYNIYEIDKTEIFSFEKWVEHIHPDEREEIVEYFEECLRERKLYDRVHRLVLRNGKVKTIHRKGEFVCNEKGEPVKMIGTTQDVTEEYRIQQELEENQKFIRKITDATPSIIASYNVNTGKYVFISEGLEKLLGYYTQEVMEKGVAFFADIIHPDDFISIMEKNARALENANTKSEHDIVVEFTYRMRHKNGTYRWFHTYGTIFDRNKENKVEHVLNISLDVSDQMEASKKIKEQEYFIQQIADASPTILYLYDVEKQSIVYINREIFFVLGYLPEEIIEAGPRVTEDLYYPEDYPLLPGRKQSGKSFQQVDSMIQYECRMKTKENELRWLLVREIVFKSDENGNIKQILGAALDINRRKEMEKTILQNTLLLEQSNASLEEFAYVASHDLKEPLRKISTFGDRLVATQMNILAPEGKLYLQKIVDASQRMQTMINDLLSISMITGNTAFEKYSLQSILDETLQTLEFKIEQQNAIIKSDPLPEAHIIPSQFRQLFQNLLSNSLKFVRPGVQPMITIRHSFLSYFDVVHYQLAQAERYQKIEIADNGIGFENEFAGKIFAIFQRLHGRSEYEGSGIGLAICKKIVEHHGGIIYASGVPEEGACFTIILPG